MQERPGTWDLEAERNGGVKASGPKTLGRADGGTSDLEAGGDDRIGASGPKTVGQPDEGTWDLAAGRAPGRQ